MIPTGSRFEFVLREAESVAAAMHAARRQSRTLWPGWLGFLRSLLFGVLSGGGVYAILHLTLRGRSDALTTLAWGFPVAFLLCSAIAHTAHSRAWLRRWARMDIGLHGKRSIVVEESGLRMLTARGEARYAWGEILEAETIPGSILLWLDATHYLHVPDTAFADAAERAAFLADVARMRENVAPANAPRAAEPAPAAAPASPAPPLLLPALTPRAPRRFARLLANLRFGMRGAFLRRTDPDALHPSWFQFFVLAAGGILACSLADLALSGLAGQWALWMLPSALFHVPVIVFASWAAARIAGRPEETLRLAVAVAAIGLVIELSLLGAYLAAHLAGLDRLSARLTAHGAELNAGWLALAGALACLRMASAPLPRRLPVLLLAGTLLWLPLSQVHTDRSLWMARHLEEDGESPVARVSPASEEIFHLQPKLMERALAGLKAGRKGVVDVYWVGAAGYASQDVFRKEVQFVQQLFQRRFGTQDRSIALINNPQTLKEAPLASMTHLRQALARVGEVMDKDEDVLFLFLTSHGSSDHKFSLEFWPMEFHELDPVTLRAALDAAGIRRRVIVVSACYSGGFVEALKSDDAVVITASAPDRNSFGCSNEAEFTYFGKAYFEEALSKTDSFIEAFHLAKAAVTARELSEGHDPSQPQLFVGERIREVLARLRPAMP